MSSSIKSLTLKVGADTSDFLKAMKSVDKEIATTTKTATALQKGLALDFDSARFSTAQKQVQSALSLTLEKAEAIKKQMAEVEASTGVDSASYEKLALELAKTETQAVTLEKKLEDINKIETEKIQAGIKKVGTEIETAGKKLSAFSAAAAVVVAGMSAITVAGATAGAAIDDLAQQSQISSTAVQELAYLALQTGVSQETLLKAVTKTRTAYADLIAGNSSTAVSALQELGISMDDFDNVDDLFNGVIYALGDVSDEFDQARIMSDIFGNTLYADLIPYVNAGEDALEQFSNEFAAFGAVSEEGILALAGLDDAFARLTTQFEVIQQQLALALTPLVLELVELVEEHIVPAIKQFTEWLGSLDTGTQAVILGVLLFVAALGPLLIIIGKVVLAVNTLIPLLIKLKAVSLSTALGFAAIAAAVVLAVDLIANWSEMSTMEKILKSLAVAALVAAAAITVFHASWSLGIAVGAITAAVVAGVAMINSAKNSIVGDEIDDFSASDYTTDGTSDFDINDYTTDSTSGTTTGTTTTTYDNSSTIINIEMNATGDLDYDVSELATAVSKKLAIGVQVR